MIFLRAVQLHTYTRSSVDNMDWSKKGVSRDKKKKRQVKVTRSLENSPNSPRPKLNLRQTSSVVLSVDSAGSSCHGYESGCHGYESSPQLRPKNLLLRASHVTANNHVTLSTSPTSPHLSPAVKPGRSSTVSGNLSSPPPIRIVKSRSAEFVRHHALPSNALPSNALPSHVVSGHVGTEPSSPTVTQRSKNSTPDSFVTWLEAAKHAVSYVGFLFMTRKSNNLILVRKIFKNHFIMIISSTSQFPNI